MIIAEQGLALIRFTRGRTIKVTTKALRHRPRNMGAFPVRLRFLDGGRERRPRINSASRAVSAYLEGRATRARP